MLTGLFKSSLEIVELLLLGLHSLVDLVILLSEDLESLGDLLLLNASSLPLRDEVVWLQESIPLLLCNFLFIFLSLWNTVLELEFLHDSVDVHCSLVAVAHKVIGLWATESIPSF